MIEVLHIPARADAAVACDMSSAPDSPDERMREYDRLFAHAMLDRERRESAVVFTFRGGAETRAWVEDLAQREAACCPFADYRVEADDDTVTWTITNTVTGDDHPSVEVMLDAYFAMPDNPGLDLGGLLSQFGARLSVRR